jgi:hypothetical protein
MVLATLCDDYNRRAGKQRQTLAADGSTPLIMHEQYDAGQQVCTSNFPVR